mmetsp:Transcript_7486/g.8170  ORF Transcript_7486/g.8170 Transcript_7486/m.8170 type:complete len:87 (+) Transcript_7486:3225-3485(+)
MILISYKQQKNVLQNVRRFIKEQILFEESSDFFLKIIYTYNSGSSSGMIPLHSNLLILLVYSYCIKRLVNVYVSVLKDLLLLSKEQ